MRLVISAIDKAKAVPRQKALRRVIRKKQCGTNKPIFAVRPKSTLNYKYTGWRSMTYQDQYVAEVFPQPPLTAFRRQKHLNDLLIKARVPENNRPKGLQNGMTKCGRPCTACPYITTKKKVRIRENLYWTINRKVDCQSYNVITFWNVTKKIAIKNT